MLTTTHDAGFGLLPTAVFASVLTELGGGRFLRHNSHVVIQNLHESAADLERGSRAASEAQSAVTKQHHQRGMPGEDADLSVIGRGDDRIRFALEEHCLRRYYRDFEHT